VILWGWLIQGGDLLDGYPWLLSIPLFLSVLPSITLAGIPDHDADKEAGKKTIAVRLGKKGAARMAMIFALSAAVVVLFFSFTGTMQEAFRYLAIPVVPHAVYLSYRLMQYIKDPNPPHRIDGLMVWALTFILWCGLVPLAGLH
jgi:4-hydroxybenzoate polyprenyltransferase